MASKDNKFEKTHCVVEISNDGKTWVSTIPCTWFYVEEGQTFTYWPQHLTNSQVAQAIEKATKPHKTEWKSYVASLLYKSGSMEKCLRKEVLASKGHDNLDTDKEGKKQTPKESSTGPSRRKKKTGKRSRQTEDRDEVSDEENGDVDLIPSHLNTRLSPQKKICQEAPRSRLSPQKKICQEAPRSCETEASGSGSSRDNTHGRMREPTTVNGLSFFEERTIALLESLVESVKRLSDKNARFRHRVNIQLSEIFKSLEGQHLVVSATALQDIELPITTVANLHKLEGLIVDSPEKYTVFVNYLSCHGSPSSLKDNVSRIVSAMATDEVMKGYNWKGQGQDGKDGLEPNFPTMVKGLKDALRSGCKGKFVEKELVASAMRYVVKAKSRLTLRETRAALAAAKTAALAAAKTAALAGARK